MRFCFRLILKEGAEAEYDRRHLAVWPEVRHSISAAGIRNYSGFRSDRIVVYVGEAVDVNAAIAAMGQDPVTLKWAEYLSDLVESRPRDADGRMVLAREVFFEPGTPLRSDL